MPTFYKLTDKNDQTYNGCQWGPNITHTTDGTGDLCSSGWTHWYTHPLLAVLLNPIHGNFDLATAHLWRSIPDQVADKTDHGLKVGCAIGATLERIPIPVVTDTQKIAFGILCALEVYTDNAFINWAEKWLNGVNRSVDAAEAAEAAVWAAEAAEAAEAATRAAVWAAEAATRAAVWAAKAAEAAEAATRAAVWAAEAATRAAVWAAKAAEAAEAATRAAVWAAEAATRAAVWAAKAAEAAARAAAWTAAEINLIELAEKAMLY